MGNIGSMVSDRDELLAQVAYAYYHGGEGLSQIAKTLGRSVSMASRLLQEARDRNLVEIRINYPLTRLSEIEAEIEERFGIDKAHVFTQPSRIDSGEQLYRYGSLCAASIEKELREADLIGVSWGRQVNTIVSSISVNPAERPGTVVQASGASGALGDDHDGARITQRLADRLGYTARLLPSPLIVDTIHVAEVLRSSVSIISVLNLLKRANILLTSVGAPFSETSGLARSGYLSEAELDDLRTKNAAADILGFHLDRNGELLDVEINFRVIGIWPDEMRRIPNVVLAVTGIERIAAILAVLRGRYCNSLLTDRATAEALLAVAD
ncbi:MAG: hypothetical protein OXI01_14840 [Albidovulum sp.]|nr:hypothetical protein [Albidovulum sp.]